MKVYYSVQKEGVVEIDNSEWDEQTKEDYGCDIGQFVLTYVSEEIHEFDEGAIAIIHVEELP